MVDFTERLLFHWGGTWFDYTGTLLWQLALTVGIVWIITRLARKKSAAFRYALWMLVPLRLILPTDLSLPFGVGTLGASAIEHFAEPGSSAPMLGSDSPEPVLFIESPALADISILTDHEESTRAATTSPAAMIDASPFNLTQGLFLTWFCGVALFSVLNLWRCGTLRSRVRSATPISSGPIHELDLKCRERIRPPRFLACRLFSSENFSSPVVTGMIRPKIILPKQLVESGCRSELGPLILHELAHVKRWDVLVNWIQVILQVFHWYNPLVWFANREIRRERELACDDRVLLAMGLRRKQYGSSLLKVLELSPERMPPSLGLIGMAEQRYSMKERIKRIMDTKCILSSRLTFFSLAMVVLIGCLVLPAKPAENRSTEQEGPGGTVVGKVLLPDSSPAAGAKVWARTHDTYLKPLETSTDRAGRFEMFLPVGSYFFNAKRGNYSGRSGYCSAGVKVQEDRTSHEELRLLKGCIVEGNLVDSASGKPVEGALIVTGNGDKTRTAADGTFSIPGVPREFLEIIAVKKGYYRPLIYSDCTGRDKIQILMNTKPEGVIRGKVTDVYGIPIADAQVTRRGSGKRHVLAQEGSHTDREGNYTLEGIDPDRDSFSLLAIGPEQYPNKVRRDLQFPPGSREMRVDFQLERPDSEASRGASTYAREPLMARSNTLTPPKPTLAARGVHWLEGSVVDDGGSPLAGALVIGCGQRVTTNAKGRFRLENLPAGTVKVGVYTPNTPSGFPQTESLGVDQADHVIAMPQKGQISGRVVRADTGKPVQDFTVRLGRAEIREGEKSSGRFAGYSKGLSFNSPDGTFTVSGFSTVGGLVYAVVEAEGFAPAPRDRVKVRRLADIDYDAVTIPLEPAGKATRFHGEVRDAQTGKGLEDVKVTLLDAGPGYYYIGSTGEPASSLFPVHSETNQQGFVEMDAPARKVGSVVLKKEGYAQSVIQDVNFNQRFQCDLSRGATIRGTIPSKHRNPSWNPRVCITREAGSHRVILARPEPDSQGRFFVTDLPAGECEVSLRVKNQVLASKIYRASLDAGETYEITEWSDPIKTR